MSFFISESKGVEENASDSEDSLKTDQVGSGEAIQSSSGGFSSERYISNEDAFVEKIALLVTKKINPRLTNNGWTNYDLSSPNTAITSDSKLDGPLHYDNTLSKDHENDGFGYYENYN